MCKGGGTKENADATVLLGLIKVRQIRAQDFRWARLQGFTLRLSVQLDSPRFHSLSLQSHAATLLPFPRHAHAQTHTPLPDALGTFLCSLLLGRRPRSQFHYSGCRQCKWVRWYRGPPRVEGFAVSAAGAVGCNSASSPQVGSFFRRDAQPCFLSRDGRTLFRLLRHLCHSQKINVAPMQHLAQKNS